MEEKYKEIENLKTQKEARKFYQMVNVVKKDFNSRTMTIRKRNGELMCNIEETLKRWRDILKRFIWKRQVEERYVKVPNTQIQVQQVNAPVLHDLEDVFKKN